MAQPRAVADWAAHHVLALPEGASLELLLILAQMRFNAPRINADGLKLSRHSRIVGPVTDAAVRKSLKIPAETPVLFSLQTPRERGEPPFMGLPERTGIARACPAGLPIRDEGRVLNWAVAVARRLSGTLRIAPSDTILRPDIESSVDLTILSPVWLDPAAAHKVVSATLPHVQFHQRAPEQADIAPVTEFTENAAPNAPAPAQNPEISDQYGLGSDLESDGRIDVLIGPAEDIPPALQPVWKGQTPISYQVQWTPLEIEELELEDPPVTTKIARRRAFDLVARTVYGLFEAIGGQIMDDDRFLVDPRELA